MIRLPLTHVNTAIRSKYQDIRGLVGEDRDGLNLDLVGVIPIPIPCFFGSTELVLQKTKNKWQD